jgi:signal recognition particle receptor subunit beta
MEPKDKTVNEMVEERRKELRRLLAGALHHLVVERADIDVIRRRKVDVFDPDAAIFIAKADVDPALSPEQVAFVVSSIESQGYTVKLTKCEGERLLLLI